MVACQEPDPPQADFPSGWSGMSDAMHVDIKVPGEHLIMGERFDAEMQVYYLHPLTKRMPTVAIMIRAQENGYNYYFQEAIDAFNIDFQQNQARCAAYQRRKRRRLDMFEKMIGYNNTSGSRQWQVQYSTEYDSPAYRLKVSDSARKLQDDIWDPLSNMTMPTLYFYRYDGSTTEPPCGEWVSWFVADKPMVISFQQLEDLKKMIFLNVDETCQLTSTQFGHSVARTVQETADRPVWQCTQKNFGPDP
jgi:Eukaryotic-type carbonic anhydrase